MKNLIGSKREYNNKDNKNDKNNSNNNYNNKKIICDIIIYLIFIAISIFQIILIFNNNVWGDEAFSLLVAKENWITFFKRLIIDVHPPLYYIILKIAMILFGNSLIVAKLVSLLPIFLTNIVIITMTLKKEEKVSVKNYILLILFLLVTNISKSYLYMGLEIRMYSWASFFVTMSAIYGYKVYKDVKKKNIILFIILSLCAALTHYFALVMEVVIYTILFVFLVKKKKANEIKNIIMYTILGYALWIPFAIKQFIAVQKDFWITFKFGDIWSYVKNVFGMNINDAITIFLLGLIVFIIINVIYKMRKKQFDKTEKEEIIFSICSVAVPFIVIMIGTLCNIMLTPVFTARYINPSICLFWIGVISLLRYVSYKKIFIAIFSVVIITTGISSYKNKYKNEMATGTTETLKYMQEQSKAGEVFITNIWDLYWSVLEYYFPNNEADYCVRFNTSKTMWLFEDKRKRNG